MKPWKPSKYALVNSSDMKALEIGGADEHQQKRALEFIINDLCKTYDLSFRPDSQRDTDFAEGKRFVGLEIVKLLKINLSAMRRKNENKG